MAGTDRLDTELMIGQMQGKFRVVVLADCGHCIQEDVPPPHHISFSSLLCVRVDLTTIHNLSLFCAQNPDKTAEILLDLKKRYDIIHSKNNTLPRLHE